MKIILIQVLLPLATYAIGVLIGIRTGTKHAYKHIMMIIQNAMESDEDPWNYKTLCELVDQEEIQHVGYTPEQCGYDK